MNLVRACGCIPALAILLSFMNIPAVTAGPDLQTITFDRSELTIERLDGFDRVSYGSFEPSRQVGFPQLPVKLVRFLVPPGRVVASITVTGVKSEPIDGQYIVFPTQAPQVLSKNEYRFVPPQKHIYDSMVPFPAEPATARPGGYFVGQNIGALAVYPVQYIPALKQLVFYSEINIRISYRDDKRLPLLYRRTPYTESIRRTALQTLLKDSEPVIQEPQRFSAAGTALPAEDHAYVIITSESLADAFKPLADWKYRKGLGATTVTTAWIYQNYTGPDNPAKVRNFIKDAYQNWGTVWVLLGGDSWIVPTRYTFAFDCEYGAPSDNDIPCDLYYSDLDGSWNANGNSVYGEVDDNVDMYPDVFVGRVSVEDTLEAAAYVGKLLSYEHSLYGTERDMLFLAAVLWDTPYTNSGLAKNHIDELYVPDRFDPITKLYQANGNEDYTSAMNALNAGHHIINHCGHAYIQTLNAGLGYLMDYDMDILSNGPHYSILFSIGCWPASFDEDCIAEHFIQNPDGGGVAFVGNSRYGWGSPGNPLYGYSDRFDQQFFKQLFVEDNYHIGRTLAAAKAAYVPFAGQENVYRWCEYELNLLGDPEMMIWTDDAAVLAADHPAELFAGESHCPVTVTAGGVPVEGALVCVMQSGTFYESGFTGPDGRVTFGFNSSNPVDPVLITATAHNCIPYTDSIPLIGSGPYVQISRYTMDGSEEGFVSPDDLVQVEAYFKNFGTDTAFQVSAELICSNPLVTIVDGHESIPYIAPGEFKWVLGGFSYTTAPGLIDGDVIQFNTVISDSAGHVWTDKLCATGATPVLFFSEYDINDDAYGDGDGLAESGETVQLNMLARNTGRRPAHLIRASLESRHLDVQVINSSVVYWSIPPSGYGQVPASVRIDPDCPQPSFPLIDVVFETSDGYIFSDSFTMAVGDVGFFDDMEGGDGGWTHSGAYDHWHRSSYRQYSGSTSWYSGHEGLRTYISGTSTSLKSPPIVIDRDSELSFWCWYEFPNYGTDGFYVNLYNGQEWITLDYIGSGGALGILPTGNTWLEYTYDLSEYAAGTTIAVRFHQVIDLEGILEEGVYIDDVSVRRRSSGDLVTFVPPAGGLSPVTRLHQNYPNPFNPVTTIGYSLEQSGQVSIVIFNIQGAQVRTLLSGTAAAGPNSAVWDGKNDSGTAVSSGVYFYRLVAGDFVQTKKMVLLR